MITVIFRTSPFQRLKLTTASLFQVRSAGKKIIAMQGRFHFYEGYSHKQVTFPLYVMKLMGVKFLIVSNACGALNPQFRKTDLMLITSHVNFHFTTPLMNFRYNATPASAFYSKRLIDLCSQTALENSIGLHKGVYLSVQGPNLETRAEYAMVRKLGADVVGMSTIPEVLVARQLGFETLGLSIITDEGFPDTLKVAVLEEIVHAAGIAEPRLTKLTVKLIGKL